MHGYSLIGISILNDASFFKPVLKGLQEVESILRSQSDGSHPELGIALQQLLSSGGKRIRPTLGLLTGQMLGAPRDKLVILAAAVELLHTATLVHDDLIDGSLLRRGNPTLNAHWSSPATVLAGDFYFAQAAKLAAETDHLLMMKYFAQTLAVIVNGELTQLFSPRGQIDRESYYKRIYAKTASLIEMTTSAAAMISLVEETVIESMRSFGYNLGMAFQIVDDVLDFVGEQGEVGKPIGSDLQQGLVTLPAIYYAEAHPDNPDVRYLTSGYSNEPERLERLVQAVRQSSGIKSSLDEAQKYIDQAQQVMAGMPDVTERQALSDLAYYIVARKT
jgi:geranylgeranyl pyrophosphate synthase